MSLCVASIALTACGQAGAQPTETSGLKPPPGWQPLPALATSARAVLAATQIRVAGFEAWGEPARGCYAVWLALQGEGASSQQVIEGIEGEQIELRDVVKPEGSDGLVAATFIKAPYRGRLRARIAAGRITALACFANEREPAACQGPCTSLLGGLP
jgi:hypothetical protein